MFEFISRSCRGEEVAVLLIQLCCSLLLASKFVYRIHPAPQQWFVKLCVIYDCKVFHALLSLL